MTDESTSTSDASCMDDFDPSSLSVEQARSRILSKIVQISDIEDIPLNVALGRVHADSLDAPLDVPGFRNSAMDGYAFQFSDIQHKQSLKLAGTSFAGHPWISTPAPGECIKVMTGALIPEGLDTVVMHENTTELEGTIVITQMPAKGDNLRETGSNLGIGSEIISPNTRIGPAEIGLISSMGISTVSVLRRLKVGCFSTGDELVDPGTDMNQGQIYDSNRHMLIALLSANSIDVVDLGISADTPDALRECLALTEDLDLVISTGGVSVGDADFVRSIIDEFGELNFWKIAMKPGRPLTHAVINHNTQYFGLPGNPVSSVVTFDQFVRPAINALLGQSTPPPLTLRATLLDTITKAPGRVEYQRGILNLSCEGKWEVSSTGHQDSHILKSMGVANCYIVLELASTGAIVGDEVVTVPFLNYRI